MLLEERPEELTPNSHQTELDHPCSRGNPCHFALRDSLLAPVSRESQAFASLAKHHPFCFGDLVVFREAGPRGLVVLVKDLFSLNSRRYMRSHVCSHRTNLTRCSQEDLPLGSHRRAASLGPVCSSWQPNRVQRVKPVKPLKCIVIVLVRTIYIIYILQFNQ